MPHDKHDPTPVSASSKPKNIDSQLPITPDRERMSRALGAAFLQHKVQQLERNLDDLSFRRDINYVPTARSRPSHRPSFNNQPRFKSKQPPPKTPVPIKIIDTSVLIHALPLLKKWNRDAKFKIIIPLDVISELDFLKSSPPPIHGLVREATSWLDSQFKNSNKQSTIDSIDTPCLIPQRTGDESKWDELSKRFIPPPIQVASIPMLSSELVKDENEKEEGHPEFINRALISTDLPQRYRSLFQCSLYYQTHAQPNQETQLVIFIPEHNHKNLSDSHSHPPIKSIPNITILKKPAEIKSGNGKMEQEDADLMNDEKVIELFEWADHFQLQVQKIFDSDLIKISQSNRNQIQTQNHKKNKITNNHNHHYHQNRTILKSQLNPPPPSTTQPPSEPKPFIQRTILTRNAPRDSF